MPIKNMIKEEWYKISMPDPALIALLSDIHEANTQNIVSSLQRNIPDFICISGDLILGSRPKTEEPIMREKKHLLDFLRKCSAITTTMFSLGNHEWMLCEDDLNIIRSTNVILLDNGWINIGDFYFGGLTSGFTLNYRRFREDYNKDKNVKVNYPYRYNGLHFKSQIPEYKWIKEFAKLPGYKILLSHHPEYWVLMEPYLCNYDIDLVLSGHAHGGQISLWGQGLYAPGQGIFPKYVSGIHKGKKGSLIVSRGLKNTSHFIPRLGNPREIVYLKS